MKSTEQKISLVGWGEEQVMLHTLNGHPGVSVVENGSVRCFGMVPWLKGLIAVLPPKARYVHGTQPAPEHVEMVLGMRQSAVEDAIQALYTKNIFLLGEAVATTYVAQQYMGGGLMPNLGEIGKRFSGNWGVYIFSTPHHITQKVRKASILVA
jgi:hypothetical protein